MKKIFKKFKIRLVIGRKFFLWLLTLLLLFNQLMITRVAIALEIISLNSSMKIVAPKINSDGKTTSLYEWPTITNVMSNSHTGNKLADAKVVMTAKGKPFYAPDDISFDDPINAQKKWGVYETSLKLSPEQEARYQKLITLMMTCSYCCGEANKVTMISNCGCAHAKAVRGFYRFMITNYGDKYNDEQLVGESHRWYALWYPKGMLEDYLLFTGDRTTLPHQSHGGAGSDGMHGLKDTQ
ncbi:hypothetical protein A2422_01490 [Candidatus Woesebacteria bacterium RIFOXYC1_FULL_31_51]|uniref:Uncharacterized protein n=1 Tax=Candidatus Woesebacteria bacterium GW2011_GWC2_31_9 TaxID=1618586 RepID=A0A0G0AWG8_9BACT|nr:MAG: hypothetical protein UR17_C0001G0750 [Candidatus Woesebacteria bacterium GW2011_GWF1_31_35]KKP22647.1 MAG: hypothetical protein UR11_C0002G0027 [Candidatus Woesebacteria bacterium GW2011_GWC1_30_29]KKP26921.1 MAG: hypothetical protein UR13_C0001G0016 [Candidatus Woesebacteria bacterium GW2011_GWD1_31_12]KKP27242.1 MAG: hypothetical protein UR16_C0005G0029 [Candidatus Woesebacteria bacterium GW2011_GWB1_31_29]KKP30960.1 MAG: hypothetical protein UR21_C0019G0006 [Candidatus Woesebacteria 